MIGRAVGGTQHDRQRRRIGPRLGQGERAGSRGQGFDRIQCQIAFNKEAADLLLEIGIIKSIPKIDDLVDTSFIK